MTHEFTKLDEIHDEYGIILQGGPDESKFGRVFNKALRNTHQLDFREVVHQDGEVKRKKIVVGMYPLDLPTIRARSNDFAKLSMLELRTLVERNGLTLPATDGKPERGEDPQTAERQALTEALMKLAKTPPKPQPKADKPEPEAPIIVPTEVLEMDWPNALTQAQMLGVSVKGAFGKPLTEKELPVLQQRIAKKMGEKEAAEAQHA
jgi:hypothetical protein